MPFYVLSHFSHVQFCVVPWTSACQATLSMGFSRQEYWSGLPLPSPRNLPNPEIKSTSLKSNGLVGVFFTTSNNSDQFSYSVMSHSLWPHWLQQARPPCPSPTSGGLLELMSIESVMPINRLVLCRPLLLLPSIFPSIRVFSSESALHIR